MWFGGEKGAGWRIFLPFSSGLRIFAPFLVQSVWSQKKDCKNVLFYQMFSFLYKIKQFCLWNSAWVAGLDKWLRRYHNLGGTILGGHLSQPF